MTEIERKVLTIVQRDFPLETQPYAAIGAQAGISEEECIGVVEGLSESGILRAIRAVFDWNKAGFHSILIGLRVESSSIDNVAEEINRNDGVTHNYERKGAMNLWCTLVYREDAEKDAFIHHIASLSGVHDVKEFPAEKIYKIGLVLDV